MYGVKGYSNFIFYMQLSSFLSTIYWTDRLYFFYWIVIVVVVVFPELLAILFYFWLIYFYLKGNCLQFWIDFCQTLGFSCGSASKESTCNERDLGSIPGLGRSPGEAKGYRLQYSDLQNSIDCIVHGVTKSWTGLSNFTFTFTWSPRAWRNLNKDQT